MPDIKVVFLVIMLSPYIDIYFFTISCLSVITDACLLHTSQSLLIPFSSI